MALTDATLVINSVTIDRNATNTQLIRCIPYPRGGYPTFRFAKYGVVPEPAPDPWDDQSVTLTQGTTLIFSGFTGSSLTHYQDGLGWVREWTAYGLKKAGDYVPVTDENTWTDTARFNLTGDDPQVIPSREGRNVGQIVTTVLQMVENASALTALGIGNYTISGGGTVYTLPTITQTDLSALTIIPPFEVDVIGERILQGLEGVIQTCHPNHYLYVDPSGNIRILDPRTFTPVTLTLNDPSDPRVGMPSITKDWSECYTRCLVRGNGLVVGFTLKLSDGTLVKDYAHDGLTTAQSEAAWQATDFQSPTNPIGQATASAAISSGGVSTVSPVYQGYGYGTTAPPVLITGGGGSGASFTANLTGGQVTSYTQVSAGTGYTSTPTVTVGPPGAGQFDEGTCTCPSTTTVTVTSSNPLVHWPSNFWDQSSTGRHGVLNPWSNVLTGFQQQDFVRVTANTALTAGGTSTLTLDRALPSTSYSAYTLWGESSPAALVFRQYTPADPTIAAAMAPYFPYEFAYRGQNGGAAALTTTPVGTAFKSGVSNGVGLAIDSGNGTIITAKPTNLIFSPNQTTSTPLDDLWAFIPVNTGALFTVYPADVGGVPQYSGTAYSQLGLQRTKTITVSAWRDASNATNMNLYAQEYLSTVENIVYEGSIPYYGLNANFLTPGSSLNIAGHGYTTGYESAAIPIVSCTIDYHESSDGATTHTMTLEFSSRRQPYSGALFQRPSITGQMFGSAEAGLFTPQALASSSEAIGQSFGQLGQGVASAALSASGTAIGGAASFNEDLLSGSSEAALSAPQTFEDLGLPTEMEDVL